MATSPVGANPHPDTLVGLNLSPRPVSPSPEITRPTFNATPEFVQCFTDPHIRERNRALADLANRQENRNLTKKQKLFVTEYLADPNRNGAEAAKRAGYTADGACEAARLNLKHPQIKKIIEEADRFTFIKYEVTHDRIIQEQASIAYANIFDYMIQREDGSYEVDLAKTRIQAGSAVKEVVIEELPNGTRKTRITLCDKQAAIDRLARFCGNIFPERLNLATAPGSGPLTINIIDQIVAGVTIHQEESPNQDSRALVIDGHTTSMGGSR